MSLTEKFSFPDPRVASPEGLVAYGGAWSADLVFQAYTQGIFPWPASEDNDQPILWFSPDPRGVLDFHEVHQSTSFKKFIRKQEKLNNWRISYNEAFLQVMQNCQLVKRPGQDGTWILDAMIPVYSELNTRGKAVSVEVWFEAELVGGIYGVLTEHYFSAESMFYLQSNASKYALLKLIDWLVGKGFRWMDLQMVTEVSAAFGAKLISRDEFLKRIKA